MKTYTISTRPKSMHVYLRIVGEDLDPSEVTDMLALSPTSSWLSTDLRIELSDDSAPDENGWILSSEGHVRSSRLDAHLNWFIDHLQSRQGPLKLLRREHRLEFIVYGVASSWNMSCYISDETLKLLSRFEIPLVFDIWATEEVAPV